MQPEPSQPARLDAMLRYGPAVTAAVLWVMAAPGESAPASWETYAAPLLTGLVVASVAAGIGEFLLVRLHIDDGLSRSQRVAYALALGLGALSFLVMALALCRVLSGLSITLVMVAAALLLPPRRTVAALREGFRDAAKHDYSSAGLGIAVCLLAFMVLSFLVVGLGPPFDTDSLRYHLRLPELYLQAHTFVYPERNHFAQFPLGAEMLYAIGLAYGGPSGANLIVVIAGLACLLGIYSVGAQRFSFAAGIAGAAIFATTPLVGCIFGATVTDLLVCMYVVLAAAAVLGYERNGNTGWLVLAGVCGGLATTVKLGGGYAAALVVVWAALTGPRDLRSVLRRLVATAVPVALVVAPWIIKTSVVTGNPIFPFLPQFLDGRGWRPEWTAAYSAEVRSYGHMGGSVLDYLLSPVRLATHWEQYGTPAPLGPLHLALLVALALLGRRGRPAWPLTAWCAAFFGAWLLTAQVARFVLPGLAVLAIAGGFVAAELGKAFTAGKPSIPVPLALVLVALAGWTWYWQYTFQEPDRRWEYHSRVQYLSGRLTRDEYLGLHANYYPVVQYANRSLPEGSRILFVGETLSYGLRVPALVETGFAGVTAVDLANATRTPEELAQALADRGFTHLLINLDAPDTAWARKLHYFAWRDEAARERWEQMVRQYARAIYYHEGECLYRLHPPTAHGGRP